MMQISSVGGNKDGIYDGVLRYEFWLQRLTSYHHRKEFQYCENRFYWKSSFIGISKISSVKKFFNRKTFTATGWVK